MYYIAYGSNLNYNQMDFRCPNSKVVSKGFITGWKLYFDIHANIVCTNDIHDTVPVLIWDIAETDWPRLDRYEGYPKYYTIGTIDTMFLNADGQVDHTEKCIAYIMNKDMSFAFPDEYYLGIIAEGYEQNQFPISILEDALKWTSEGVIKNATKEYRWVRPHAKNKS